MREIFRWCSFISKVFDLTVRKANHHHKLQAAAAGDGQKIQTLFHFQSINNSCVSNTFLLFMTRESQNWFLISLHNCSSCGVCFCWSLLKFCGFRKFILIATKTIIWGKTLAKIFFLYFPWREWLPWKMITIIFFRKKKQKHFFQSHRSKSSIHAKLMNSTETK